MYFKPDEICIPAKKITVDVGKNGFLGSGAFGKVLIGHTAAHDLIAMKAIAVVGQDWEIPIKLDK